MLRSDRAVHLADERMHDCMNLRPAASEVRRLHADRLRKVEVDVAATEMPEGPRANSRLRPLARRHAARDDLGHAFARHRDIVLDRRADMVLHLARRMPHPPEEL